MKSNNISVFLTTISLVVIMSQSSFGSPCDDEYPFDPDWVVSGPTINIRDLGAVGDGETNDSAAFREAAVQIEAAGSGKLIIPAGTYIVGQQFHFPSQFPYYQDQEIFTVEGVSGLIIEGEPGAILRVASGLRFGSFHPEFGSPYFSPTMPFTEYNYHAKVGMLFDIENSQNVIIRDLELDGNSSGLILGGQFGDTGWQLAAAGVFSHGSANVLLERLYSHHHGLDGVMIGFPGQTEEDPPTPHILQDVVCEYNSRQGLSWVGGRGLTAINCSFNHTGRGAFMSSPGAGVDVEAEQAVNRGGRFMDCEFINNTGCGLVMDSGDSENCCFENCTFWGTTDWAVWNDKPGMVFKECNFFGSIVHGYGSTLHPEKATRYENCRFEDLEHPDFGVFRNELLITLDGVDGNISFDGCEIVANEVKSFWLSSQPGTKAYLRNCTITHKNYLLDDGDWQCLLRQVSLENVHFIEDLPQIPGREYWINVDNLLVGEGVFVDGPWVLLNGLSGQIPPGLYNPYYTPVESGSPRRTKPWLKGFPNPFNPSTRISFSIPESGLVKMALFDQRGRLIDVLVDGFLEAGPYETRWDGNDRFGRPMGTGIYHCKLTNGGQQAVWNMTLVK